MTSSSFEFLVLSFELGEIRRSSLVEREAGAGLGQW